MPRILIVEDNEENLDMLSKRLRRLGYETLAARDGEEGVAAARQLLPDVILMDLGLPSVDGWQATRRIKRDPSTRQIPVIALTARNQREDVVRAQRAGFDHYETKPVVLVRLVQKIEGVLGSRADV